jgi:hypothetical protein
MSKIRVLQLVNGEHYAGAERVQEMLLRYLDPHLFEPSCVALINGAFVRKAQALGLPVTLLPMKHRADVRVIRELAHFLRANHIDLVHLISSLMVWGSGECLPRGPDRSERNSLLRRTLTGTRSTHGKPYRQ